jgi:hypothetical protein
MRNIKIVLAVVCFVAIVFVLNVVGRSMASDAAEQTKVQAAVTPVADVIQKPSDRWSIHKEINPLDSSQKISVDSSELHVRCSPKLEAYVEPPLTNLGHQLNADGDMNQSVRFKIDGGQLKNGTWDVSDDFSYLFIPVATIRSIAHGKRELMYEYHPQYTVAETTTIDLTGLEDALKQAGCKV